MKRPNSEKLGDFLAGKGFYVVVLLCVAAIGVSAYYLFVSFQSVGGSAAVSGTAQVTVTPSQSPRVSLAPAESSPVPSVTPAASPSPSPAASRNASPSPSSEAMSTPVFTWPVKGDVLADFSLEALAYDETMGDWRTHSGIDIAAKMGQTVLAAAAGTVSKVYDDDLMGTTVVIDHSDGMCSVYSNLAAQPPVEEGNEVTMGSIIGSVGSTAMAESGMASHLHFELTQDAAAVDPELYLPQ